MKYIKTLIISILFIPCVIFAFGITAELIGEFVLYGEIIKMKFTDKKHYASSETSRVTHEFSFVAVDENYRLLDTLRHLGRIDGEGMQGLRKFDYLGQPGDTVEVRLINSTRCTIKKWNGLEIQSRCSTYPFWKVMIAIFLDFMSLFILYRMIRVLRTEQI